jgi:hypothetical protein
MSVELFIYLASVSGQLKAALLILSLISGVASSLIWAIFYLDSGHSDKVHTLSRIVAISMAGLFISCLLPEAKTLYLMAGAVYGKEAIQSETAIKVKKIIDSQLDKILEELDKK